MSPRADDFDTLWSTLDVPRVAEAPFTGTLREKEPPRVEPQHTPRQPIEMREEIGRGGTGIVHLGVQVSLRREVAVKTVPRYASSRDQRAAIREALVTGYLEHPNVIPVYTVEEDEEGQPMIVMKRIRGVTWSDCIADPERAPRMRKDDPLGWHLDVFLAVCRAVQLAHDKGLLHRDIKPDNVIVGRHGDVYLLDWGLAAALDPAVVSRAPLVSGVTRIAGTPGYMAPEMVAADGPAMGRHTDVYLLGATLHELITGRPRHQGGDLRTVLRASLVSAPYEYDDDVPAELASICNRATSRSPEKRFQTVAELASAVREVSRKRPALRFVADARELIVRLRALVSEKEPSEETLAAVYETFGQCRSALDEALRVWPGNERTIALRDDTLRLMAGFEMGRQNLEEATELLGRLSARDEALEVRLRTLRGEAADRAREYESLKELEQELDTAIGGRTKAVLVLVFGLGVLVHNVLYGLMRASDDIADAPAIVLVGPVLVLLGLSITGFLWRRGVFRNRANRQVLLALLAILVAVFGVRAIGAYHHVSVLETYSYLGSVYAFGAAQVASMSDRRIYASAAILTAGTVGSLLVPAIGIELIGASVFLAMAVMAVVWWRSEPDVSKGTVP